MIALFVSNLLNNGEGEIWIGVFPKTSIPGPQSWGPTSFVLSTCISLPEGFLQSWERISCPGTAGWICWRINTTLSGEAVNQSLMKGGCINTPAPSLPEWDNTEVCSTLLRVPSKIKLWLLTVVTCLWLVVYLSLSRCLTSQLPYLGLSQKQTTCTCVCFWDYFWKTHI